MEEGLDSRVEFPMRERPSLQHIEFDDEYDKKKLITLLWRYHKGLKKSEKQCKELFADVVDCSQSIMAAGMHLNNEVFIPEYLGFVDTDMQGGEGDSIRVYQKGELFMVRGEGNKWILKKLGNSIMVEIKNMYDGLKFLSMVDDNISMSDFLNDRGELGLVDDVLGDIHERNTIKSKIFHAIEAEFGITPAMLLKQDKRPEIAYYRHIFCYLFTKYYDNEDSEAENKYVAGGKVIRRSRASVRHSEKAALDLIDTDSGFKDKVRRVECLLLE